MVKGSLLFVMLVSGLVFRMQLPGAKFFFWVRVVDG